MALEGVNPSTLTVTHICDGEEVVTGGEDGQVWIATFAQSALAHVFVRHVQATHDVVFGEARNDQLSAGCHRSHPHEDMSAECDRLTEVAREDNRRANETAREGQP